MQRAGDLTERDAAVHAGQNEAVDASLLVEHRNVTVGLPVKLLLDRAAASTLDCRSSALIAPGSPAPTTRVFQTQT
jgi:hypothetical protein